VKKQYLFLSLLGILVMQIGFAQQKTITGTITDETGLPLPGATVLEVGTSNGTTTDFDGILLLKWVTMLLCLLVMWVIKH